MDGFHGHEQTIAKHHDWITPKPIIDALGKFDLDPCQSDQQPWLCARMGYTFSENGLLREWSGSVWLNPPYGAEIRLWMQKLAIHGDGIALTFARTDTKWFQETCRTASAMLFLSGRIRFLQHGQPHTRKAGGNSAPAPSVLIAFGEACAQRLIDSSLVGIRTRITA